MKKNIFALMGIFSISLAACNSGATAHEHTAGTPVEENRIEATCTETGSYDLVTYCVEDHEELSREHKTIPALGHNLVHRQGKDATCTENGYKAYDTCSRCDYTTYEAISATGHDFKFQKFSWSSDYKSAKAVYVCSNNSSHTESYNASVTSKIKSSATCINKGTTTYTATYGGHSESKDINDIFALGHDYHGVETHADYDHDGYFTYTCSRCGDTYTESNGESRLKYTITWKNYDGTVLLIEEYYKGETPSYSGDNPNKTEEGHFYYFTGWDKEITEVSDNTTYTAVFAEGTRKSDENHHWYEDASGNKYNIEDHNYSHETIIQSSTCQIKGSAQYTCDCGYFEVRELELAPHDFAPWVSNNDATCTEDGTKYHICNMCLLKETVTDEGSAKGHKWTLDSENSTQPTCVEDGHYHYICGDCDETKDEEIPNYGGHNFVDGTCTKCGEFQYKDYLSLNVSLPHEMTYWAQKSKGHIYNKFLIDNVIFTAEYKNYYGGWVVKAKFVLRKTYSNPAYTNYEVNHLTFDYALKCTTDNEILYSWSFGISDVTELDVKTSKTIYLTGNSNYCNFDGTKQYSVILTEKSYIS